MKIEPFSFSTETGNIVSTKTPRTGVVLGYRPCSRASESSWLGAPRIIIRVQHTTALRCVSRFHVGHYSKTATRLSPSVVRCHTTTRLGVVFYCGLRRRDGLQATAERCFMTTARSLVVISLESKNRFDNVAFDKNQSMFKIHVSISGDRGMDKNETNCSQMTARRPVVCEFILARLIISACEYILFKIIKKIEKKLPYIYV